MNKDSYLDYTKNDYDQTCCNEPSCCSSEKPINHCTIKVGRNDPCICGSGRKFKKCCGKN